MKKVEEEDMKVVLRREYEICWSKWIVGIFRLQLVCGKSGHPHLVGITPDLKHRSFSHQFVIICSYIYKMKLPYHTRKTLTLKILMKNNKGETHAHTYKYVALVAGSKSKNLNLFLFNKSRSRCIYLTSTTIAVISHTHQQSNLLGLLPLLSIFMSMTGEKQGWWTLRKLKQEH